MAVIVLIPAAGSGARFGGDIPKQFLQLAGRPILQRVVERFLVDDDVVTRIVVALPEMLAGTVKPMPRVEWVSGGATRVLSVTNALGAAAAEDDDIIAIHDSVRPFFSMETFHKVVEAARQYDGAFPAMPVTDTIHVVDGDKVALTPDRRFLAAAQTPQCFRARILRDVLERARFEQFVDASDEAGLAAKYGYDVRAIAGDSMNFKITRPEDLAMAERVMAEWGS